MRVLRAIVQAFVLPMFNLKARLRPRRSVGAELVRDHDAGRCDGGFQKLSFMKPLRQAASVSSTLDQDVENDAVLIDGAPEPVWLAGDRDGRPWRVARGNLTPTRSQEPYVNSLKSYGSRCSAIRMQKAPMGEEIRSGARTTRANQSLAPLGRWRSRLNLLRAQRSRGRRQYAARSVSIPTCRSDCSS